MTAVTVPLGDLMAAKKSSIDPRKNPEQEFDLFSIPAFDSGEPEIVKGAEVGSSKQIVRSGDVLLSKIVPHIRRAWVVEPVSARPTIGSSEWIIFRSERFDPSYLRHALISDRFHQAFMQTVAGVGGSLLRARPSYVADIEIPLPPIEEQRRMAAVLDAADALRAKRRQAIAKLNTLTQAIFIDMFGAGRSNDGWPIADLAEVVADGTSVTYGIVQAGPEFDEGVPYIRTGDIVNGEIRLDGLRHTDPEIAHKFDRSRVRAGEIVMSIRATVGTTAIVPPELDGANLTQGTARISPGPHVGTTYLLHHLRSDLTQRWIQRQVKGATFREITLGRLRELPVPIAPAALQSQFEATTTSIAGVRADTDLASMALHKLFGSLQQRAFRGDL